MKKLFITALLFLGVYTNFAQSSGPLYISNYSTCSVTIVLLAHDVTSTSCGAFQSDAITIPGGGGLLTISDADNLNSPCTSPLCWAVGSGIDPSSDVWDEAKVTISGSCSGNVGTGISPCSIGSPYNFGTSCCLLGVTGTWTTVSRPITYLAFQ